MNRHCPPKHGHHSYYLLAAHVSHIRPSVTRSKTGHCIRPHKASVRHLLSTTNVQSLTCTVLTVNVWLLNRLIICHQCATVAPFTQNWQAWDALGESSQHYSTKNLTYGSTYLSSIVYYYRRYSIMTTIEYTVSLGFGLALGALLLGCCI